MKKIVYATTIAKSGERLYVNIIKIHKEELEKFVGIQVKVTLEEL